MPSGIRLDRGARRSADSPDGAPARRLARAGRRLPVALAAALCLIVSGAAVPAQAAAGPQLRIAAVAAQVGASGKLPVKLSCSSTRQSCRGSVAVTSGGATSGRVWFRISPKRSATLQVPLRAAQLQGLLDASGGRKALTVVVSSSAPVTRTVRTTRTVALAAPARIVSMDTVVSASGTVGLTVACRSARACVGSAALTVGGRTGGKTRVTVAARGMTDLAVTLSAAQRAALAAAEGDRLGARAVLTLQSPMRVSVAGTGTLATELRGEPGDGDGGHEHGGEPTTSHAYQNSWKPSEYDTCTKAEHDAYAVTGPDGKLYPGWHPPVHVREDGTSCTFGHEHGDDPRNSDIYDWVLSQYRVENPRADGVPFGYASERLVAYADATGSTLHRHEDDPGHKVVVSNDQLMGQEFRDAEGRTVRLSCDFLIKMHQGSWSSDATKNNTHELMYAVSCNDGTRLFATTMSNYGNANQLHASCTRPFNSTQTVPRAVETVGSQLPDGLGGKRFIPTRDCLEQYVLGGTANGTGPQDDLRGTPVAGSSGWWWAGYEQWQSFNSITTADGAEIARYEPWFGLQNPARYYVGNGESDTIIGSLNDLAWEPGAQTSWAPWAAQAAASPGAAIDRRSPDSWFNGAIRDAWLARTLVRNGGGTEVLYASPWGRDAQARPFPGSIRIVVSRTDNSAWITDTRPSTTRRFQHTDEGLTRSGASGKPALGFFYDYNVADGRPAGVHAPN